MSGFGIVARIESVDAANVSFSGDGDLLLHGRSAGQIRVAGDIDRLTGALSVTATTKVTTHTYEMLCKPVKSLF